MADYAFHNHGGNLLTAAVGRDITPARGLDLRHISGSHWCRAQDAAELNDTAAPLALPYAESDIVTARSPFAYLVWPW